MLACADGAAWLQAALVRDLVCRTSCLTGYLLGCSALLAHCSLVLPYPYASHSFLLPHSFLTQLPPATQLPPHPHLGAALAVAFFMAPE